MASGALVVCIIEGYGGDLSGYSCTNDHAAKAYGKVNHNTLVTETWICYNFYICTMPVARFVD